MDRQIEKVTEQLKSQSIKDHEEKLETHEDGERGDSKDDRAQKGNQGGS